MTPARGLDGTGGKGRHLWRQAALLAGGAAAVALLAAVPPTLSAASKLNEARTAFNRATQAAAGLDLAGADAAFVEAGRLAASAQDGLGSRLTTFGRVLPVVGPNLTSARDLANGARMMAEAGRQATAAAALLAPVAAPTGTSTPLQGAAGLPALGGIQVGSLRHAETLLSQAELRAQAALDQLRPATGPLVSRIAAARREFTAKGRQAVSDLGRARDATSLASIFFGADKPRTWFLAIENPAELRATGGLIGAFGILQGQGGRLRLTRFDSDAGLPPVTQPAPAPAQVTARYDRFGSRTIWQNVNMSPDFPTAASLIAGMWQAGSGTAVDGVIAVDAQSLDALLAAVGPVTVTSGDTISAANFLSIALNQVYIRFPVKAGRVDYLLEVGHQVWARLAAGQFRTVHGVASALSGSIAGKHLQVWIPGQEAVVARLGMSGALAAKPGEDYLLVVGQNAAGNKLDYYAQRSISYTVTIDGAGGLTGRLSVELANGTPVTVTAAGLIGDAPAGFNRSYESVYLPPEVGVLGAQVGSTPVGVESESEGGLNVVSRFLEAAAGAGSTLVLQTAGADTQPGHYRLVLQHQPLLNPDKFRVEVVLPEGDSVDGYLPAGAVEEGRRVIWEGSLGSDTEFVVNYGASGKQGSGHSGSRVQ